jgi:fructose-1-phosphate kinase PfkB-like protein
MDSAAPQARRALEESPEVLKINALELGTLAGASTADAAARVAACRAISSLFGVRWLLITRGSLGIEAFDGRRVLHARPPTVRVRNAIGSGDAAAAGVGWVLHDRTISLGAEEALASGECLREALLAATAMGTANCMNPVNGKVERADYLDVKAATVVEELPHL